MGINLLNKKNMKGNLKPVVVITRTTNMIKTSGIKGTKVIKNIGKNLKTK